MNNTLNAINRFNDALARRDFTELEASMTQDCVFEDTDPRPNGQRIQGREAIVDFFAAMVALSPESSFEVEEILACEDRCIVLWNHRWTRAGIEGNNRGVDVFRVRDGKVVEKLAYTKNG